MINLSEKFKSTFLIFLGVVGCAYVKYEIILLGEVEHCGRSSREHPATRGGHGIAANLQLAYSSSISTRWRYLA